MVLAGFLIENGNFCLKLAHGNFNAGYRSSEVVVTTEFNVIKLVELGQFN